MQLTYNDVYTKGEELGIILSPNQIIRIKKSVNRSAKGPSIELAEAKIKKLL